MDTPSKYLDIAKKYFKVSNSFKPKAIFVPHASLLYSGLCAATAYSLLVPYSKEYKNVILLCTHHFGAMNDGVITNKKINDLPSWISMDNSNYFDGEHSYHNNIKFINYILPKTNIISFLLGRKTPINDLAEYVVNLINNGYLVVCTSDLTHYGSSFHNIKENLNEPIQSYANKYEGELLSAMVTGDVEGCYSTFSKYLELTACGEIGIKVLTKVAKKLKLNGKVTCHYDSYSIANISTTNIYNLFTISPDEVQEFVRYASIAYSDKDVSNVRSKFDDMQLLSIPKSIIDNKIVNNSNNLSFPMYNFWSKQRNGAFVTIKDKSSNNVRACIGRYESGKHSTLENCIISSYECVNDAKDRWKNPINKLKLDNLHYELSILEKKSDWKRYPGIEAKKYYKLGDKTGIVLYLPKFSAVSTFLPSVWEEHSEWSIDHLMKELSYKATNNSSAWLDDNTAFIEIYRTEIIE